MEPEAAEQRRREIVAELGELGFVLPGTLNVISNRCGKPNCRCARGALHGPYLYRRWREGGRQRCRYVRAEDAGAVREALAAWRRLHPPARSLRDELAELRRLLRHLDALEV